MSGMNQIRTIVFDFFGVFVNKFAEESARDFCRHYGVDPQRFQEFAPELAAGLDIGDISERDYCAKLKEKFGIEDTPEAIQSFFHAADEKNLVRDDAMFDILEQINKTDYTSVLLSNVSRELAGRLRTMELYRGFDEAFLSCDIGLAKPDSRMFQSVLSELNGEPDTVVFIDDNQHNAEAARNCGMCSILHRSVQTTRADLSSYLDTEL